MFLAWAGYVADSPATPAVVSAMHWGYIWGPAICFGAATPSALLFKFDPKLHAASAQPAPAD